MEFWSWSFPKLLVKSLLLDDRNSSNMGVIKYGRYRERRRKGIKWDWTSKILSDILIHGLILSISSWISKSSDVKNPEAKIPYLLTQQAHFSSHTEEDSTFSQHSTKISQHITAIPRIHQYHLIYTAHHTSSHQLCCFPFFLSSLF